MTSTYGPDTYGPWYEGKSWTCDSVTNFINPPETALFNRACELEVVAVEEVTVPAGTFNCYKVNTTLVANYGVEIEPYELRTVVANIFGVEIEPHELCNTTWWSAEEDVPVMVKDLDFVTYDRPVTRELVSFSDSVDNEKADVAVQPTPEISSLPTPIPDPTYWPDEDWRTSTPEKQGIDSELLADMFEFIQEQDYGIDSISIIRNGYLVTDMAIYPFIPDTMLHPFTPSARHILYSAQKSIVSALIGIAIDKGYIESIDQPVLDFFPDFTFANVDDAKRSMTLEHLLTMTTGLDWADTGPGLSSTLSQMLMSVNWVQPVLDNPMVCAPGSQFNYNSGASFILSAIIEETTGMTAFEFAREHLFGPLGITDVEWPSSYGRTGVHLRMQPHDMAKIGYLYLHNGVWNNEQVVSSEWVQASTAKHITLGSPRAWYGYQWWMKDAGFYFACGKKGQYIIVVPEKNMVVVFTSGEDNPYAPLLLFYDFIIPAVKSDSPLPANAEVVELLESRIAELVSNS